MIKKVKNTVSWTYLIEDINGEKKIGTLCKKELQKSNKESLILKKINK